MREKRMKLGKWFCSLALFVSMMMQFVIPVFAAGASISASASTIYVGDSVTFTINVSGAAGNITVSGAVTDYVFLDNESVSYTVTGNAVGSLTVSISGVVADFNTEKDMNVSDSVTVYVVERPTTPNPNQSGNTQVTTPQPEPEPKSSNADLESLSISKGTLTPEFSADVTEYSVSLEKDVTSITIEASAADANASVSGIGEVSVEPGENTLTIGVTAEDGTLKQYVIKAHVDETPDVFVTYNGKQLGVVKKVSDTQLPTSFEETKVILEGKEVTAFFSNFNNLTIIYMVDDANERNFYLYDSEKQMITSVYIPIALLGKNVAIIDIPEELQSRSGMTYGEVNVDDQTFMGWSFEDPKFENYALLYLMDEKGNKQYYLYERSENTLQLYSDQAAATQTSYDELSKDNEMRMMIILVLAATNVVTLLTLLIVSMKKRKPKKEKVVLQAQEEKQSQAMTAHEEEEEIIPFDAWKYEDMPQDENDHTIHLKPYEEEQHLFESNEETNNE